MKKKLKLAILYKKNAKKTSERSYWGFAPYVIICPGHIGSQQNGFPVCTWVSVQFQYKT